MDLQLADAQLYIVVAILVAIAAITTADIRDEASLLPKRGMNAMSLILLIGSGVSILHIVVSMLFKNNYEAMSKLAVFDLITHSLALSLLLVLVCIWYWACAIYKETPAGMPTNPVNIP